MKKLSPHSNQTQTFPPFDTILLAGFLGILLYVILINAWVTEDAYISFRTLDNFINGYGLTWNVEQRVQVFTHPLWLFLHVPFYWITHEVYFTTLLISILCDIGAIMIAIQLFRAPPSFTLALFLIPLLLSKAFMEYTTSGLETPLTFFLLVLFYWILVNRDRFSNFSWLFALSFIAALAAVNRLDTLLFYLPALIINFISYSRQPRHWQPLLAMTLGALPLIFWELFSIFYYGFFFPNTAYAKLATGLSSREYLLQGIIYAIDLIKRDPVATVFILSAIIATLFTLYQTYRQRQAIAVQLVMGIGLIFYCLYIVRVGGDFMTGRFWAAPFFLAVLLINDWLRPYQRQPEWRNYLTGAGLLITFLMIFPKATIDSKITATGIADERGYYLATHSLLNYNRYNNPATHDWALAATKIRQTCVVTASIGMLGYYAPKSTTFIDLWGITDPLLARLPIGYTSWRIGHFQRVLPNGYEEACLTGKLDQLSPPLANYYQALHYIIAGPLFDWQRLKLIIAFNLGQYDGYLQEYIKQHPQDFPLLNL